MPRILFVMDPYETLNQDTETSLLLMQSLITRGACVYWCEPRDLLLESGILSGWLSPVVQVYPLQRGPAQRLELARMDAVIQRKDPPFDVAYLHLTYLLDFLPASVLQFNTASGVRRNNEKLSTLLWPQFCPPSLVTQHRTELADFVVAHQDVVVKPLDDCSGRGIVRLRIGEADWLQRLDQALGTEIPRLLLAQPFLEGIAKGDKRIYLCDGEVVGLVNRVPKSGSWLGNIHQGASVVVTALTEREQEIVAAVGPWLREQGLFLCGMDVIDGYLTELNVTSPSAIRQINAVMGIPVHEKLVDAMLSSIQAHQRPL